MAVAPLLAPAGVEMRVVSQAASFTWGSWSVSWPEGYEPPNPPAEDRELGWVADLGGKEVEPFGRCFVRADAQIDATLGRSNVEDVLDAARYRTSGEVFLETEIPFENLAGQLPYRDFDVNSLVPIRVGGRILENQLVTKVEESEDEQGNRTATTYIGGQKFQDREALRTRNREIDRVIAQERLERGDEIGARLAASQEYEREQRDNLKRYVDRRDGEVTTSAEEDASAKAGAALSTARTDAKAKADSAQSQAELYARQQDVLKLREAKEYADGVAGDKATKEQLEEARQALTNYREQVAAKIGEQGTLTTKLDDLNRDYTAKLGANGTLVKDLANLNRSYTKLSNDFTAKVGENGTLVRDQNNTANVLDAMINGTAHRQLTGTQFQQQQQSVNLMQSAFNRKQVGINTGFQNLFKAQDDINAVNSAFQAKQHTLNSGFQALFEAQRFTNEMQNAFNKKQTGINRVYDAMWEQQQYTDLAQNYVIEYNRIMAESRQAQYTYVEAKCFFDGANYTGQWVDGEITKVSPAHPDLRVKNVRFVNDITYVQLEQVSLRGPESGDGVLSFAQFSLMRSGFRTDNGLSSSSDSTIVIRHSPREKNALYEAEIGIVFFPRGTLPSYQKRLDALAAEYRKKGLRV